MDLTYIDYVIISVLLYIAILLHMVCVLQYIARSIIRSVLYRSRVPVQCTVMLSVQ